MTRRVFYATPAYLLAACLSPPLLSVRGVHPRILLHPGIILRRKQENQAAVRDFRDQPPGPLLLHGGAAFAATGAIRRDVRRSVYDDTAIARPAVETVRQAGETQPNRAVTPAGALATEVVSLVGTVQAERSRRTAGLIREPHRDAVLATRRSAPVRNDEWAIHQVEILHIEDIPARGAVIETVIDKIEVGLAHVFGVRRGVVVI